MVASESRMVFIWTFRFERIMVQRLDNNQFTILLNYQSQIQSYKDHLLFWRQLVHFALSSFAHLILFIFPICVRIFFRFSTFDAIFKHKWLQIALHFAYCTTAWHLIDHNMNRFNDKMEEKDTKKTSWKSKMKSTKQEFEKWTLNVYEEDDDDYFRIVNVCMYIYFAVYFYSEWHMI